MQVKFYDSFTVEIEKQQDKKTMNYLLFNCSSGTYRPWVTNSPPPVILNISNSWYQNLVFTEKFLKVLKVKDHDEYEGFTQVEQDELSYMENLDQTTHIEYQWCCYQIYG